MRALCGAFRSAPHASADILTSEDSPQKGTLSAAGAADNKRDMLNGSQHNGELGPKGQEGDRGSSPPGGTGTGSKGREMTALPDNLSLIPSTQVKEERPEKVPDLKLLVEKKFLALQDKNSDADFRDNEKFVQYKQQLRELKKQCLDQQTKYQYSSKVLCKMDIKVCFYKKRLYDLVYIPRDFVGIVLQDQSHQELQQDLDVEDARVGQAKAQLWTWVLAKQIRLSHWGHLPQTALEVCHSVYRLVLQDTAKSGKLSNDRIPHVGLGIPV
ncbi:E3 SUMO-protein ligase NSE2 isoform 2 [Cricetulus griseus]|nr:E3 SUMO-protein ligase NSE2 isoform 2 [Cricetulus griseus]